MNDTKVAGLLLVALVPLLAAEAVLYTRARVGGAFWRLPLDEKLDHVAGNGLRLAGSLAKRDGEQVWVFLIGDAAACAKAGQKVPQGYYNLELMLRSTRRRHRRVRHVYGRPRYSGGRTRRRVPPQQHG